MSHLGGSARLFGLCAAEEGTVRLFGGVYSERAWGGHTGEGGGKDVRRWCGKEGWAICYQFGGRKKGKGGRRGMGGEGGGWALGRGGGESEWRRGAEEAAVGGEGAWAWGRGGEVGGGNTRDVRRKLGAGGKMGQGGLRKGPGQRGGESVQGPETPGQVHSVPSGGPSIPERGDSAEKKNAKGIRCKAKINMERG